jgi:hypothetical protein
VQVARWHAMPHALPCFAPFLPEAYQALRQAAMFMRASRRAQAAQRRRRDGVMPASAKKRTAMSRPQKRQHGPLERVTRARVRRAHRRYRR